MRIPLVALLALGIAAPAAHAAPPLHKVLFAKVSGVAEADQRAIAKQYSDWGVAADGKGIADANCGVIPVEVRTLELATGAPPGVLVVWGNACTSGHAGSSVSLFVKGAKGYAMQMGFPGFDVVPLPSKTRGWVDLRVEGPNECQPVWAWTGRAYDLKCNLESRRGACREMGHANKLCQR